VRLRIYHADGLPVLKFFKQSQELNAKGAKEKTPRTRRKFFSLRPTAKSFCALGV
jgi:hypothetical protein